MSLRNILKKNVRELSRVQCLEKELAQIQLSTGQLPKAKDALFGQVDLISPQPSTWLITSESIKSLKAIKSDELSESSKLFREEVQELRNQCRTKKQQLEPLRKKIRNCLIQLLPPLN